MNWNHGWTQINLIKPSPWGEGLGEGRTIFHPVFIRGSLLKCFTPERDKEKLSILRVKISFSLFRFHGAAGFRCVCLLAKPRCQLGGIVQIVQASDRALVGQ